MFIPVEDFEGNTAFIRTLTLSNESWKDTKLPILVIIHGFGSSSAQYYMCFREFRKHFYVILIDNIGTGLSSKPEDYKKSFADCAERSTLYMTTYIERWRQAMDITDFYLMGHSYGGYMAGSYASIHH